MSRFRYVIAYWLPIFIYCLLIFIQSTFIVPDSIPELPYLDKAAHFLIYAGLGVLFIRAFRTLCVNNRKLILISASIAAATFYGMSDELHQLFVPYRDASIMDVVADAIGSSFGVLFYNQIAK